MTNKEKNRKSSKLKLLGKNGDDSAPDNKQAQFSEKKS